MNKSTPSLPLQQFMQQCEARLSPIFSHYLQKIPALELKYAMEYTLGNGGKHLRPLLIYATGSLFNVPLATLDVPAAAIELIHTYSLIHDDLPCMDDADLRRGKPSCHQEVGEGMAVLTGDALQMLAMQVLISHPAPLSAQKRLLMLDKISRAAGCFGMAAGQALDISLMANDTISDSLLLDIYRLKTGALFTACIELGYLSSADDDENNQHALQQFAAAIGLAFQIQDDILDSEASSALSGKPQGIDVKNNKLTYAKLHGHEAAKEKVDTLYQAALESINYLGQKAQLLRELTGYMLQRL